MRVRIFSRAISSTRSKNAKLFLLLLYFIIAIFNCLHKLKTNFLTFKLLAISVTSLGPYKLRTNSINTYKNLSAKKKSIRKRLRAKLIPQLIIFSKKYGRNTSFFNNNGVKLKKNTLITRPNNGKEKGKNDLPYYTKCFDWYKNDKIMRLYLEKPAN
ncbi:hypothetical protein GGTG_05271 [Gaeumannomyces tritici R3-111a-1]|uniref:Uncharacterized protein n=1 Tax=Gaeumannomyces tritici (strain R3-111a-1) TaxID=644352 RepID=J3NVF6_GAET3|nr:hypothetical protein GGTG_05271 [Gaeumannomyces tritici R3-111a-1]EJT75334.1 hypothetical protein GGTG_05271 [Gaeumannomyces tritici R3-111a-1]